MVRVLPDESVLGRLFEHSYEKEYVVTSDPNLFKAHDILNWKLCGPSLLEAPEANEMCLRAAGVMMDYMNDASNEERETYVNSLVYALGDQMDASYDPEDMIRIIEAVTESSGENA